MNTFLSNRSKTTSSQETLKQKNTSNLFGSQQLTSICLSLFWTGSLMLQWTQARPPSDAEQVLFFFGCCTDKPFGDQEFGFQYFESFLQLIRMHSQGLSKDKLRECLAYKMQWWRVTVLHPSSSVKWNFACKKKMHYPVLRKVSKPQGRLLKEGRVSLIHFPSHRWPPSLLTHAPRNAAPAVSQEKELGSFKLELYLKATLFLMLTCI